MVRIFKKLIYHPAGQVHSKLCGVGEKIKQQVVLSSPPSEIGITQGYIIWGGSYPLPKEDLPPVLKSLHGTLC